MGSAIKPMIVIVGPTASGKTDLSVAIAKKFNGVCINADATQLFNGLSIATNKISHEEMQGVPHLLFDIIDLNDSYSVKEYQRDARSAFEKVWSMNKLPILVGGTGLYINAAIKKYDFCNVNDDVQQKLKAELDQQNDEQLWSRLRSIDDHLDQVNIHPHNRKRIIRAIINYETTKIKPSAKLKFKDEYFYDTAPLIVCLLPDKKELDQRIANRVDVLTQQGLVDEISFAYNYCNRDLNLQSMQIIGVRQIVAYLHQEIDWAKCRELMCFANRHYAKKQVTWFRHQLPLAHTINFQYQNWSETIAQAMQLVQKYLSSF